MSDCQFAIRDVCRDVPVDDFQAIGDIASIAVTPSTPSFNSTQQMVATATMDDGSTRVVTSIAEWSSSDLTKATINASGLATKVGAGTTVLKATFGGKSGQTTATVT